jgi:hypothetical protein
VGATATYQINVKNAAGIYSQTVEQPAGGSSVLIIALAAPTAGGVATGIKSVTVPAADATSLALPTVPNGYTIAINASSDIGVIGTNGTIAPPVTTTSVVLVFTVTRTSDNTTADTGTITVTVPAHS